MKSARLSAHVSARRNEGPFDVRAAVAGSSRSRVLRSRLTTRTNLVERRGHGCKKQRGRAAAGVIIADRAKGVRGSFHRVPADRAVHMQIDETRREEVSREVDDLFTVDRNFASQRDDLSRLHAERKPVGNPLREKSAGHW